MVRLEDILADIPKNSPLYNSPEIRSINFSAVSDIIKTTYYTVRDLDYVYPEILSIIIIRNSGLLNPHELVATYSTMASLNLSKRYLDTYTIYPESQFFLDSIIDYYSSLYIPGRDMARFEYFDLSIGNILRSGSPLQSSYSHFEIAMLIRSILAAINMSNAALVGPYIAREIDFDPRPDIAGNNFLLAQYTVQNKVILAIRVPVAHPLFAWLQRHYPIYNVTVKNGLVRSFYVQQMTEDFANAVRWAFGQLIGD